MKDQSGKRLQREAVLQALARSAQANPDAAALDLAALTLALEAGARQGKTAIQLDKIITSVADPALAESWAVEMMQQSRSCLADRSKAKDEWKEALEVIHPLGMDLS